MDGDHEYDKPPLAFKVVLVPEQIDTGEPALAVGEGLTVIVIVAVEEQPPVVPVTVYVVVEVGVETGVAIEGLLNPVVGVQLKLVAPLAVKAVEEPEQIVVVPETETVGIAFTVTVTVDVP